MKGRAFWILASALVMGLLVAPVTSAKQSSKASMDFDRLAKILEARRSKRRTTR